MQDVRYNTIQWVHRATRGWSYGGSVSGPADGRDHQGPRVAGLAARPPGLFDCRGLTGSRTPAADAAGLEADVATPCSRFALARLRQLSAHEVGHTIGSRAQLRGLGAGAGSSVMDYPAPLAVLEGNRIELGDAYGVGLGRWDVQAVKYGYVPDPSLTELVLAENRVRRLALRHRRRRPARWAPPRPTARSGTTAPTPWSRAPRTSSPSAAWPSTGLGESVVREGRPLATLEEALVPLYLRHRYQVEATAHLVGRRPSTATPCAATTRRARPPGPRRRSQFGPPSRRSWTPSSPTALALPGVRPRGRPAAPAGLRSPRASCSTAGPGSRSTPSPPAETAAGLVFGASCSSPRAPRAWSTSTTATRRSPASLEVVLRAFGRVQGQETDSAYQDAIRRSTLSALVGALIGLGSQPDDHAGPCCPRPRASWRPSPTRCRRTTSRRPTSRTCPRTTSTAAGSRAASSGS